MDGYGSVGMWIRDGRGDLGLTQKELAEKVGRSRAVVANWERGSCLPGRGSWGVLAEFFGVAVDDVMRLVARSKVSKWNGPRSQVQGGRDRARIFKVLILEPRVEWQPSCGKCGHVAECQAAVSQWLPMPCEAWDVHDMFVAQSQGVWVSERSGDLRR